MADIQRIIHDIVSSPKIAASRNFASRVYRDEPILYTIPQIESFTPPKIREMRKLARRGQMESKVFLDQGRFMESYEDDFRCTGEFVQYFPTYQSMNDAQLRGYFSWRTRVRRGMVEKTSLSFAFVYIYELLNQIGVKSAEEGFHALKRFWTAYREFDSRIDGYAELWLKDYAIYHNLDKSLLEGFSDIACDQAITVLLDYRSREPGEVFAALNSLSSYNLEKSKFFKECPDDIRNVVHRVFSVISDYYNRNPKNSAREKLFGRVCTGSYSLFRSAILYRRHIPENRVYEIGDSHRYICRNGDWSCERFVWYGRGNKRIGAILKTVDYLLRRARGYKSALLPGAANKILTGKIEKEIARYERDRIGNAPPKIDIDVSKLRGIRSAALSTQARLLVGEPEEEKEPGAAGEPPDRERPAGLSGDERRFLRLLLSGEPHAELLRTRGLMLSVLIDGVNAKLFDLIGDTAVVDGENGPEVPEDYREAVEGMIAP